MEKTGTRTKHAKARLPASTLESFEARALSFRRDLLHKWIGDFAGHLARFPLFDENGEKPDAKDGTPVLQNEALEDAVGLIFEWADSLQNFAEALSVPCFLEEWHQQFQDELSLLPANIKTNIPEKYWEISDQESWRVRIWKRFRKQKLAFQKYVFKSVNHVRGRFRRELLSLPKSPRSFASRNFFRLYYEIPVGELLVHEWQQTLQRIAVRLHAIHDGAETVLAGYLLGQKDVNGVRTGLLNELSGMRSSKLFEAFPPLHGASFDEALRAQSLDVQQKWWYAGTYILPGKLFRDAGIEARKYKLREKFEDSLLAWSKHLNGELEDWKKSLELILLQCEAGRICAETVKSLTEKTTEQLIPSFQIPIANIADSVAKFKMLHIDQVAELKSEILSENRLMVRKLRREQLPHTGDVLSQTQMVKSLDNYLSRIRHAVSALADRQTIFKEPDFERMPPESKFVEIELKELVSEEILSSLESRHNALIVEVEDKLAKIMRDLSETDQIVEFNLEAAMDLLENQNDAAGISQAHGVAVEGLERAGNRLKGLSDECLVLLANCEEKLTTETGEFNRALLTLADNEKVIALQFRVAKAKTQQELRDYRLSIIRKVKSALPELLSLVAQVIQRSRRNYLRFRKMTGLIPVQPDVEQKLTHFLNETKKQFRKLPHVYQRLFRFEPLKDSRFFAGREAELDLLAEKFAMWKNGDYAATALVGEKGSGRTTLLHFAETKIYANIPVFKVDLARTTYQKDDLFLGLRDVLKIENCETLDEMEQRIIAQESRFVCIFENLHNLFLRTIDGFEALERFLLLISNTNHKIFWVITCGLYSWNYLDKVVNLGRYFQEVVFLRELSIEEISSVILKRHRVSGYTAVFEAAPNIAESRRFQKLTTHARQQEYLQVLFFEQLSKLSLGNITVAILFWLKAIKTIDGDKLLIQSDIEFDPSFLRLLPVEDLFTFAAFLQHETLTEKEHALIFNQGVQKSSLMLRRMANKGLLVETKFGYQITFLLYRPIVRTLKLNNIIH